MVVQTDGGINRETFLEALEAEPICQWQRFFKEKDFGFYPQWLKEALHARDEFLSRKGSLYPQGKESEKKRQEQEAQDRAEGMLKLDFDRKNHEQQRIEERRNAGRRFWFFGGR